MDIEETLYFELSNGKTVKVKELDPKLQEHVKVLDKLRNDVANKNYELNVYRIALQAKNQVVQNILEATYVGGGELNKGSSESESEGKTK